MNIFVLHDNPIIAAKYQCDKHVVKMILESGQMLSTAHRVLDGEEYVELSKNNRRLKRWRGRDQREQASEGIDDCTGKKRGAGECIAGSSGG